MDRVKVMETMMIKLDDKSRVDYIVNCTKQEFADKLLEELKDNIPWREVTREGRHGPYKLPRLQCWMSSPGVKAQLFQKEEALEWTPAMWRLKLLIEATLRCNGINVEFDYVLMNYYRDGLQLDQISSKGKSSISKDKIGFHCDDEAFEEGKNVIASISLGATRTFQMVPKKVKGVSGEKKNKYDFLASHGSLIVMSGDTQLNWLHAVMEEPDVTEPRINLTFRKS